ncbi:MAG: hypothetical protein PF447_14685, partial [Spirochaetaceae bacterium]|nr:hypothetical protein [Spirochaetaceae bacterium]
MPFKRLIILSFFLIPLALYSQNITQMQFQDQPIRDILLTLAEVSGQSIITDETVDGQASYFFADTDFHTALDQFLSHYGIFYRFDGGTYYVSRIQTEFSQDQVICRAEDVDLQMLIRRLSRDGGITVLHDALPREKANINFSGGSLEELLEIIIKPYPLFFLEKGEHYYYLRKEVSTSAQGTGRTPGRELFTREGPETFSADLQQIRFREALISLMETQDREFSFLGRNDNVIEFFRHSNKSFEEMLNLLMEQGNAGYQLSGDIFYIYDLDRQDILKQYFSTIFIPLNNISVDRLSSLIPSSLGNSGNMKLDKENNAVILTGNLQEIQPLENFIHQLDSPQTRGELRRYDLNFITLEDLQKALPLGLQTLQLISLTDQSFLCQIEEDKAQALDDLLVQIDKAVPSWPVELRYLHWDSLKENLPPGIEESQLSSTADPYLIFFQGSRGQWMELKSLLSQMDQPVPQIRYEVLVLQLTESQGLGINNKEGGYRNDLYNELNPDHSVGLSGSLAGLASITFDVINQFGYQYGLQLSADLTQNRSRVLTDTTLHGLSGETVNFQNTNTTRHPITVVDPDNIETITGFREITSGLTVEITGNVSGDGMITMEVKSTISSQDTSEAENTIPSTSEKIITTHVRSQNGEPIILSGLKH